MKNHKCFSRSGWWQTLCGLDAANQGFGWTDNVDEVGCGACRMKIANGDHVDALTGREWGLDKILAKDRRPDKKLDKILAKDRRPDKKRFIVRLWVDVQVDAPEVWAAIQAGNEVKVEVKGGELYQIQNPHMAWSREER